MNLCGGSSPESKMKNILVVNVNWIGDVIFSTPVFRALRVRYPQAHIVCMAVARVVPVLECCPYVDEIIVYDEDRKHKWLWGKIAFAAGLRKFHFDAAFLLHRSWTRAFLVYLGGARERIGYDLKDLGRLLTHKVERPAEEIHRADYYLHIIESYGIEVTDRTTEIVPAAQSMTEIEQSLAQSGIFENENHYLIVINTGGNWPLKRWPKDYFAALIERLVESMGSDVRIVISGADKDVKRAQDIRRMSAAEPVVLAGKTSLEQTFALMKRADLVISADSGPLHIASSVGTSTIAIFGPTRPEVTGPRGKGRSVILQEDLDCNRRACYQLDCPDNRCMRSVSVDDVLREAVRIFREREVRKKEKT